MNLREPHMLDIIPNFMKDDAAVKALASFIDSCMADISSKVEVVSVWNSIDKLTSEQLDALAQELYIPWYDKKASMDARRKIIKESDLIHATLGTKAAVERVANIYFGESKIVEWFEYDGNPYCFKIETVNQQIKDEKAEEFLKVLEQVKRKSAHLDAISVIADSEINTVVAVVNAEYEVCESILMI